MELGKDKIDEFLSKEPGLDLYKTELARIMRLEGHVLSHEGERLLAMSTDMARVPGNVFSLLTNADIEFPKIKYETGTEVELTEERYSLFYIAETGACAAMPSKAFFQVTGKLETPCLPLTSEV